MAHGRAVRYEPTPEMTDEVRERMQIAQGTQEELLEAQRRYLEAATPRVHPLVWAEALKAADGDVSRIAVYSYTEVYILNGRDKMPASLVEHFDETA